MYGSLYLTGASTAQSLTTSAAKMTGFTTAGPTSANAGPMAADGSVLPVAASDKITVKPGVYRAHFDVSGSLSGAGDVTAILYVGGVAVAGAKCIANFAASNAKNNMGFEFTFVNPVSAGDVDVEIYLVASGSLDFTPIEGHLSVERLDG